MRSTGDRWFYEARSPAILRFKVVTQPSESAANATQVPAVTAVPFVSCIMPTSGRRYCVPDAIDRFLAQDYPARELVILDDGADPIDDLIPSHPSVRYIYQPSFRSLGVKRNAACEAARGEIILHWDDDDWYAPHRIRAQINALCSSGAQVCGLDRVLFYDPRKPAAWEYVYPAGGAPWVYGATLCHRREYWREHVFPDTTVGEENNFCGAAGHNRLCVIPDNLFFVGLVHAANTSPKQVRDPRWQPGPIGRVLEIIGPGWPAEQLREASRRAIRQFNTGLASESL
jgi:glycosyltransferase involved in cell wall biosynthesis